MSKMKMFYKQYPNPHLPVAERFSGDVLSLPIHPYLEEKEVEFICKSIGDFYGL